MGYFDVRFGVYVAVTTLLFVTPGPEKALVIRNALLAGTTSTIQGLTHVPSNGKPACSQSCKPPA
jgi:hypothetical protein